MTCCSIFKEVNINPRDGGAIALKKAIEGGENISIPAMGAIVRADDIF